MRKLLIALLGAVVALCASAAFAGDYHTGTTLICSDCHTMHFSRQHDFKGGTNNGFTTLGTGPNERLIKAPTRNALCLTCHEGQTDAPDVLGNNTGNAGEIREAGALNQVGGVDGYQEYMGHTLGSLDNPPGTDGTYANPTAGSRSGKDAVNGLNCGNCHGTHNKASSSTYRNLTTKPGGTATAVTVTCAAGTNDLTKDVFERDATLGQIGTHYDASNVDFNEPTPGVSNYGNWCKVCHTSFHGSATDANMNDGTAWLRHPTQGAAIGATTVSKTTLWQNGPTGSGKTNWLKVMNADGVWPNNTTHTYTASTKYEPSCFTCHKAHGNKNAYGLIEMQSTGAVTEEGTANGTENSRDLCITCHQMGF